MINIVSFNGGRGAKILANNFLKKEGYFYTSIVNAYDDGKSTGNIRNFFKMLGPSDIRKVQEDLLPTNDIDYKSILHLYTYRYDSSFTRENIIKDLDSFANNATNQLVGVTFHSKIITSTLRVIIKKLLDGIELIEKAEGKILSFEDCSIMNLIYAGANIHTSGNFEAATILLDKLFKLNGTVLPTNNEDKKLIALREDGTVLFSEAEIVELRSNSRIKKVYLLDEYPKKEFINKLPTSEVEKYFDLMNRQVTITSKVESCIEDADIIIYAPGTQHSSLYPSYMSKGLTDSIIDNKNALKIFVCNIGEDYETPSYTSTDFINGAYKYLKLGTKTNFAINEVIDFALVNNSFENKKFENYIKNYESELENIGCKIIFDNFEDVDNPGKHNGKILVDTIIELFENRR